MNLPVIFDGRACPACDLPLARGEVVCDVCGHGTGRTYSLLDGREVYPPDNMGTVSA